jgi:hypothetical protein
VARQHLERRGVGAELVVSIAEVWLLAVIERAHRLQLCMDGVLHRTLEPGNEARLVAEALSQHQQHGALDVVAGAVRALGLGGNAPASSDLKARSPENLREVRPDTDVLMGEHDHLEPAVRHVSSHR